MLDIDSAVYCSECSELLEISQQYWRTYHGEPEGLVIDVDWHDCRFHPQPRWIPVSERLPYHMDEVLICYDETIYKATYEAFASYLDDSDNSINCRGFRLSENDFLFAEGRDFPTHWMPLPELPEAQQ